MIEHAHRHEPPEPGRAGRRFRPSRSKALSAACVAVALAMACSACGGSSSPKTASGQVGSSHKGALKGTLTFADWEFLEAGNGARLKAAVTSYEKLHPGVTVQTVGIPNDSYGTTIDTELAAHKGPDVFVAGGGTTIYNLEPAGLLSPITLTSADTKSLRPENSQGVIGGKRYGVVWEFNENDMLYNKKIFREAGISAPPSTYSSFMSDCMTIKQKTGLYGFVARNMLNELPDWYNDYSMDWVAGFGGSWMNAKGQFTVDSRPNVEALKDFIKVYDSGCMETGQTATVFRSEFQAGKIGMLIDNIDAAYTYTAGNKILTNSVMGGAPVPWPKHFSGTSSIMLAINKNASNQALAENFVQWLMSPAGQKKLVPGIEPNQSGTTTSAGAIPASFIATAPWTKPFLAPLDANSPASVAGLLPRPKDQTAFSTMLMPYIAKVEAKDLTPAQALSQAQAAAIRQFGN
jgi:multiple sugar transport system substrate-binding protein